MSLIYKNNVKQLCTAPSTTDPFDFDVGGSTPTGFQAFSVVGDTNTCTYVAKDSSGNWENGIGTYASATNTLTRTTILASSNAGAAETFTGTVTVALALEASTAQNGYLASKAESPTSAGIAGEVGTLHVLDISGLTADQDFTLPAVCAVGDRVGVMLAVGDATYELLLKPATGDTINGGSVGAEWSRLFITGEVVIFRCVTADSAWVVEQDGRIPSKFKAVITTAADGETAATLTAPTSLGGAWTEDFDAQGLFDTSNSTFTVRRAATWLFSVLGSNKDSAADQSYFSVQLTDGASQQVFVQNTASGAGVIYVSGSGMMNLAAGGTAQYKYRTAAGGLGCAVSSYFLGVEVL